MWSVFSIWAKARAASMLIWLHRWMINERDRVQVCPSYSRNQYVRGSRSVERGVLIGFLLSVLFEVHGLDEREQVCWVIDRGAKSHGGAMLRCHDTKSSTHMASYHMPTHVATMHQLAHSKQLMSSLLKFIPQMYSIWNHI